MDRKKIVDAILNRADSKENFSLALKYLSDTNLLSLAIQLGIDTDAVLS